MANGNYRQVTYIQFDTSSQSQLMPPHFFALRLVLLTLIVVTITIITMSALISRDSTSEESQTSPSPVQNTLLPRDLIYKVEYDKLQILSINSVLTVQVNFQYKSSEPYDAHISLRDIDKNLPQATWRVKDVMTDTLIGFFTTDDPIAIANGTEWTAKYAWLKYSPPQKATTSNDTTSE